ncbi:MULTISPECIES: ATP-dependent DNA helicase RecG [Nocardia]|uniref:ATP-dependent DNA helicase RecG n=1 Tax=Nocardia TaxID=1817 RepID=UPI000BF1B6CF|nr:MULTISPECIES: ATP-dependent DNA helicase RecG [Nocardia]MBF6185335.1 ATP-dependent DNA helicase RecG [Nocardia farcinica]MBF6311172.1 ATP-dependent DNA helicase RecG [Nocardia farcinica]MBF6407791.1 ATP-dependent DNA helicase RecG [Nocardia farcinica]PEH77039.1 ATP-dependent DNA helicase RecG [Nocardia sp. FDAARGOS_372]UEX21539.1 ATP-dependent DNA helicase RecG [Nocardia farcinica]
MATLSDRLDHILGAKAADSLADAFDMHTVEDLLRHYPLRYATQGQPLTEEAPEDGSHITVIGRITKTELRPMRNRRGSLLKVQLDTGSGRPVDVTFFNGDKVKYVVKQGLRAMMSGNVSYWRPGSWSLSHPGYLILPETEDESVGTMTRVRGGGDLRGLAESAKGAAGVDVSFMSREFIPVYPATAKVQSWDLLACVRQVLEQLDPIDDPLPLDIREERGLLPVSDALRLIHLPEHRADIDRARDRLRFDEALALQLVLAERRHEVSARTARPCPPRADGIAAAFAERLPFELTAGQQKVIGEISADLARTHPMHRLLQGEVGSGKTIVALHAMLQVVDAGQQCALLAPTEVLAAQHYRSLTAMLGELGTAGELGAAEHATRVVLVTGSMSASAKKAALLAAVTGEAGIVIGTHALIQDNVEFFDLGMVIVDEQHRFGVEQRDALRAKAKAGTSPHLLVMTATPIPRTIAMTTLGDLETSTLTELPRGRSPITSKVVPRKLHPNWVDRAWERILEEVGQGRQAYVVCSRIGDDEEGGRTAKGRKAAEEKEPPPTQAVLDVFEMLRHGPLASVRVGLLHGRLPADEKDEVMRAFHEGAVDVLVCTTVVEVGVDVPNATVMVIVDADRFGVSQLHQLRGRVGRGAHTGLCLLVTDAAPGGSAMTRLEAVAATNDGFELAVLDLRQRREGDVLGSAQSGTARSLRLLSLLDDLEVITTAQDLARRLVEADPGLREHPGLAAMMHAAVDAERLEYLAKS